MAKQIECSITGRIDDYSFYNDRLHGYLVRRTGGVTAKQYRTDQRYAAARDASSEFSIVSGTGKLIRSALEPFLQQVKDATMVNRLNKELIALKQLDNKHPRGERRPETRMTDPDVNKWFRIFQFNKDVNTYDLVCWDVMPRVPSAVADQDLLHTRICTIKLQTSAFPADATHAGLTLVRTVIDFERKEFNTSSNMTLVAERSRSHQQEVSLYIDDLPSKKGIEITCLQVVFFNEKEGKLIQLKGKVHSMGIIEVRDYHPKVKGKLRPFRKTIRLQPDIRLDSQRFRLNKYGSPLKNHPT